MKRTKVVSSNIKSIGYDEESLTLEVEFHNGAVWQYLEVPRGKYNVLKGAQSKGKCFHYTIKGKYKAIKVTTKKLECYFDPDGTRHWVPMSSVVPDKEQQILGTPASKATDLSQESGIDMSQFTE